MDQKEGTDDELYLGMKQITLEKKPFRVHCSCARTNEMENCSAYAHNQASRT